MGGLIYSAICESTIHNLQCFSNRLNQLKIYCNKLPVNLCELSEIFRQMHLILNVKPAQTKFVYVCAVGDVIGRPRSSKGLYIKHSCPPISSGGRGTYTQLELIILGSYAKRLFFCYALLYTYVYFILLLNFVHGFCFSLLKYCFMEYTTCTSTSISVQITIFKSLHFTYLVDATFLL